MSTSCNRGNFTIWELWFTITHQYGIMPPLTPLCENASSSPADPHFLPSFLPLLSLLHQIDDPIFSLQFPSPSSSLPRSKAAMAIKWKESLPSSMSWDCTQGRRRSPLTVNIGWRKIHQSKHHQTFGFVWPWISSGSSSLLHDIWSVETQFKVKMWFIHLVKSRKCISKHGNPWKWNLS